jgi:hypothetical protein
MKHARALRATLWSALLAPTTPAPSLHSPEKASVMLYITKISLSTRTCLVVRTYMRILALSGTNSAFL